MSGRSPKVLCIGAATLDAIAAVEHYPASDERVEAVDFVQAGGGPAATAAVTLARLGIPVSFVGTVGDDPAGKMIRDGLATEGVDLRHLSVVRGARSAMSVSVVDLNGDTRAICAFPGSTGPPVLAAPAVDSCRRAAWVHVDHMGYESIAKTESGEATVRLSIDAGNPIHGLSLDGVALFAPTDDVLSSRYEGLDIESAMQAALGEGAGMVVVTLGSEGSMAATTFKNVSAPSYETDTYSTLGAGDVFHGALLAQLLEDRPLEEALTRANKVAALSCRALDGRSAIPTARELQGSDTDIGR